MSKYLVSKMFNNPLNICPRVVYSITISYRSHIFSESHEVASHHTNENSNVLCPLPVYLTTSRSSYFSEFAILFHYVMCISVFLRDFTPT